MNKKTRAVVCFWFAVASPSLLRCNSNEAISDSATPDAASAPVDAGPSDVDAAVPPVVKGDALPQGAISFFNRKDCPLGWTPFAMGAGRAVVPGAATDVGITAGEPLSDGEDRLHDHSVNATLSLSSVDYAGIAGEANHGVARAGTVPLTTKVDKVSSGLPYVQLLICKKTEQPAPIMKLPPSGVLMFFAADKCPDGWGQPAGTLGRFLVGLPEKGNAGQSFGGLPLPAESGVDPGGVQTAMRGHHHSFAGQIKTSSHGIALLSGGAAGGYAKDATYDYRADSEDAAVAMPYIRLLQCQKL